jgi:hypothetical protein
LAYQFLVRISGTRTGTASILIIFHGLPVLLALAQGRSNPAPQVSLATAWAFEAIIYDDPGLIRQCVAEVESNREGSELAEIVLRGMKQPSPRVVTEALDLLDASHDARVQRSLLRGLIAAWHGRLKSYPGTHPLLAKARAAIERLRMSEDWDVSAMAYDAFGFFADNAALDMCLLRALRKDASQAHELHALAVAAEERGRSFRTYLETQRAFDQLAETLRGIDTEPAIAAGELFLRAGFAPEDIRERTINDDVFLRACAASLEKFFADTSFKLRLARLGKAIGSMVGQHIDHNGYDSMDLLTSAMELLKSALEAPWTTGLEGAPGNRLANLLPLCAAAAEIMPDLYRRLAEEWGQVFASRLQIAASRVNSFPGRQAALILLALTRVFSPEFAKAIIATSTDVHPVQRTLLDCVDRIREIEDKAFSNLDQLLRKPSANICYFATRIALAIVSNENLPPQRRAECRLLALNAIAAALEKASPFQVVSIIERGEDEWTPRIRNVGLLRDLLQEALAALSSISLAGRNYEPGDGCAVVRFHAESPTEPQSFDLRIGGRPAEDPVPSQRLWLQTDFGVQIPQELNDALTDLRSVAESSRVSCADLADRARRSQPIQ